MKMAEWRKLGKSVRFYSWNHYWYIRKGGDSYTWQIARNGKWITYEWLPNDHPSGRICNKYNTTEQERTKFLMEHPS